MSRITPLILATSFIVLLTAPSCLAGNVLYSGETLQTGQSLNNGPYQFIIQDDCNLVLYTTNAKPIWASDTGGDGNSGCRLTMQADGDLVVYSKSSIRIWASNTKKGKGNYVLHLQKDRNVVIYGSTLWATGTHIGKVGIPGLAQNSTSVTGKDGTLAGNVLYSGESLQAGQFLNYGPYKFILQDNCNLVLYDTKFPVWWSTGGGAPVGCRVTMQDDGNLVVYSKSNRAIWASKSDRGGRGSYVLILQKDRNVVIYGSPLWSTRTNIGILGIPGLAQNSTSVTAKNGTIASV